MSKDSFKNKSIKYLLNSLLLISIVFIAILIDLTIINELIFFDVSLPNFIEYKVQNRFLVILFLSILLKKIGQKYYYLFKINPLKNIGSYIWIISILFLTYFVMQTITKYEYIFELRILPLNFNEYIQFILITVVLIPVEEELLYRGLLLLVPNQKTKYLMLLVSSLIFASMHDDPSRIFYLGLGLGLLAIRFNNIWIPIIAHAIWNLFVSFFTF